MGPGALVGQLPVILSDGRSRKPAVVGGALTMAVSLAVSGSATSGWWLAAGAFLFGVGSTSLVHAGEITAAAVTTRPLESTLARLNLAGVVGDVIAPVVIALSRLAGVGWRPLFWAAAVITLAYAVWLAVLTFPPAPPPPQEGDPPPPQFRTRAAWGFGLLAFLTMPLDESLLAVVLAFVEVERGVSPAMAVATAVGFVVGGVLSFTVLVRYAERWPGPVVFGASALLMAASILTILVAPIGVVLLLGISYSVGLNSSWLVLQAATLRLNPGREGLTKAIVEVAEIAGLAVPFALGLLADRAGLGWALAGYAAIATVAALASPLLRPR